uniref:Uncharacterized protein n=1 Tax=Anopheles farauti TaxID=69004 RepID=A0A182QG02_9DIPT
MIRGACEGRVDGDGGTGGGGGGGSGGSGGGGVTNLEESNAPSAPMPAMQQGDVSGGLLIRSQTRYADVELLTSRTTTTTTATQETGRYYPRQENFAVDPYCGGGINSGGQWPIPNCGGPMCHHGPGPGGLPPGTVGPGAVAGPGGAGPGPAGPGMGTLVHGPSQLSLHGPPLPPPPLCNPCSNTNSFNSVPLPGPSRWGPQYECQTVRSAPDIRFITASTGTGCLHRLTVDLVSRGRGTTNLHQIDLTDGVGINPAGIGYANDEDSSTAPLGLGATVAAYDLSNRRKEKPSEMRRTNTASQLCDNIKRESSLGADSSR